MYKASLVCSGLPEAVGEEAALDITKEFAEHRAWHTNVRCYWDGKDLHLVAENDFDSDGQALLDEFGDCISAYVRDCSGNEIKIKSVIQV